MAEQQDPIVDEIHAIRERIWNQAGGSLQELFVYYQMQQQVYKERLVSLADVKLNTQAKK